MIGRMSVLACMLAALVATSVSAQKGKVYKTPQEVFDAAKAAAKKGDMKAFFSLVEPDTMGKMTAGLAVMGTMYRGLAEGDKEGKFKEQFKPLFDAMDKHGLTPAALKKIKPIKPEKDAEKVMKAAKPLVDLIKDKTGFVADTLTGLEKVSKKKEGGFKALGTAKLTGVKIDGDKAKGTVVNTIDGKEKKDPIEFVKVGKGWMIKIDLEGKKKDKDKDD